MFRTTLIAITGSVGKTQDSTIGNYGSGNTTKRIIGTIFRVRFAHQGEIACWLPVCEKRILCEDCPELQATRSGLIVANDIRSVEA